ncbi:MAG: TerC family protein [Vicinamibacterales bacterium]
MDIQAADFVTIGALIALEGLLSADNALVMAIMVLGLPRQQHRPSLRYGLIGGFVFRILATLLAVYLIRVAWVKLAGGLYLLYLTYSHFWGQKEGEDRRAAPKAKPWLGLSAFWATVVRVELVNLAFSIDSILVAVAMSPKMWVVMTGGLLGIVALRLVVGQLITLVERYPALVDGAFIIIAWIGVKLCLDYLHTAEYVAFEIPHWVSLSLIIVIFAVSLIYARMQGPVDIDGIPDTLKEKAEELIAEEGALLERDGTEG